MNAITLLLACWLSPVVVHALALVPDNHLAGLRSISFQEQCPEGWGGYYVDVSKEIHLCEQAFASSGVFDRDKEYFVLHEIGHHYWYSHPEIWPQFHRLNHDGNDVEDFAKWYGIYFLTDRSVFRKDYRPFFASLVTQ